MVEEDGADIIKMTVQGKETPPRLIGPDLNLVIVAARDEEGLGFVKVDTPDGTVMLLESIYQSAHTIVPKLNGRRV